MDNTNYENENSVKNEEAEDTANTEEETKEESEQDKSEEKSEETNEGKEEEAETESEKEEEADYRPKPEKSDDVVPIKKYVKIKKELQALKKERESDGEDLTTEDLDSLAEEYNLEPKALKKLATTISSMTLKQAQKLIAPIQAKAMESENEKAFNTDFEKSIVSKYPHLASKKEQFKKIAFSPDFVHLKNLEAIRKEFFAEIEAPKKKINDNLEGGSKGVSKGDEEIDFANMTDEQHARVLKNPTLRAKYYKFQDEQGL